MDEMNEWISKREAEYFEVLSRTATEVMMFRNLPHLDMVELAYGDRLNVNYVTLLYNDIDKLHMITQRRF